MEKFTSSIHSVYAQIGGKENPNVSTYEEESGKFYFEIDDLLVFNIVVLFKLNLKIF